MRLAIIIVLVALALAILVRAIFQKRGSGIPWLLVVALLIPAGVTSWFEWRWQQEQEYISKNVVAEITGNPDSRLECQRLIFAVGDAESSEYLYDAGDNVIGMKYSQCAMILNYYRNTDEPKPAPTADETKALHLLASEAVRISGKEKDPTKISCLGNRNLGFVVAALGGTEKQGNYAAYEYQEKTLGKNNKLGSLQCFRI